MTDVRATFADRHIGVSNAEQQAMLAELGYDSLEALVDAAVPASIREHAPLALDAGVSEQEALLRLRELGERNEPFTSLIGIGYYDTYTPPVILRNVLENPAWYTAYTPYQPEISQGRLEALVNFQTMVTDLTAMEIANASMLDEATAAAEAMALLYRVNGKAGNTFVVDGDCLPQTIDVVRTRAEPLGITIVEHDPEEEFDSSDCFGVLLQYPGASGAIRDYHAVISQAHADGALVAVAADLLALTLLVPPGEMGADVVVGSSQRFGVPLGFGGPHAAYFATRDEYKRTLPGRLAGVSIDAEGRPAYRLTLQTREQHIRREKATSNICTAQVLLAVIAGLYASYHGADGLRAIAERVHRLTCVLVTSLGVGGYEVVHGEFFDTINVLVPGRADKVIAAAEARGINLRLIDFNTVGISLDETSSIELVEDVCASFGVTIMAPDAVLRLSVDAIPGSLRRTSEYLTHPVFTAHRSEHQMLRYLRALADRDLALDRTMIPLGSCTMKLNATAEMEPITWPEWGRIHPFAPIEQVGGYVALINDLEAWLAEITGYDAVSLQPNAGSQGEYAGLLAIRLYHQARGEAARNVCLIPASTHGTNPASAAMAGLRVVVVKCDDNGNVDLGDLEAKAVEHKDDLAALMVTYPSTHGVYEEGIGDLFAIVHEHGGQVYLDGANLNALVGVARPGKFGADVSHINLHKTFCIPHGGGGPGIGPIGARAHLAPFLPNSSLQLDAGPESGVAMSAAPWGSAGILPISWAYITMMGAEGLLQATQVAILNANYIARRLAPHYPVLYTGAHDLVAHECIIDIRPITAETGVTVDDVAKRLIDYGFHAPTMSFPVAGTLMIEPTESEDRGEIDRFIDAMIAIRAEITAVGDGTWPADDNPLVHAPRTAVDVTSDEWKRAYPRELAAFPVPALRQRKYWPPVGRIDSVYGDRNVFCSCPPLEAYED